MSSLDRIEELNREIRDLHAENERLTEFGVDLAVHEKAVADLAEARAGLSFWSRRYVETERQARVDVAAKDRYKAEHAALKAAVEAVRAHHSMIEPHELYAGFCRGCEFMWPCPTFEMVSEEAIRAALAAAGPTPTEETT